MSISNAPSSPAAPSLLARSVENISTVLGVVFPKLRNRAIHAGLGDVLVPVVLLLLVQSFGYRVLQPSAAFNVQVLQGFAGATGLAVLALALCLAVLRKGEVVPLVVGVTWALALGNLLSIAALLADPTSLADWMVRKYGLVYVWPLVFLLLRLGGLPGVLAFTSFALPAALMALPWFLTLGRGPDGDVAFFDPDVEAIYARQPALLASQSERLRPGRADRIELFAVLGAGYPHEGVFRREVEAVSEILTDRFGASGRVVSLINSVKDQETYPLMNRVNLRASLKAIAKAMNPDDIALLFLTSHAGPGFFATNFDEVITRDVAPADVASALDEAGIKNAVIIVSACYSGSFVDALASPDRLILTAADADNVSFGCNDKNEWTDWGRAFFDEALAQTRDFRQAAEIAKKAVLDRETEEGFPPSSPQIMEGADIGRVLDAWLAQGF